MLYKRRAVQKVVIEDQRIEPDIHPFHLLMTLEEGWERRLVVWYHGFLFGTIE